MYTSHTYRTAHSTWLSLVVVLLYSIHRFNIAINLVLCQVSGKSIHYTVGVFPWIDLLERDWLAVHGWRSLKGWRKNRLILKFTIHTVMLSNTQWTIAGTIDCTNRAMPRIEVQFLNRWTTSSLARKHSSATLSHAILEYVYLVISRI